MKMKIGLYLLTVAVWLFVGHIATRFWYEVISSPNPISVICELQRDCDRYKKWWLDERKERKTFEENFYKEFCK